MIPFAVGDRVQLSAREKVLRTRPERTGTVLSLSDEHRELYYVHWDDEMTRRPHVYHANDLAPLPERQP